MLGILSLDKKDRRAEFAKCRRTVSARRQLRTPRASVRFRIERWRDAFLVVWREPVGDITGLGRIATGVEAPSPVTLRRPLLPVVCAEVRTRPSHRLGHLLLHKTVWSN
jgi:hypothetical protein